MAIAITATICAAGLVLFLQHRALSSLQSQTQIILRQISEQTATDVAAELRRILDGPVFDTLTAVNHPELRVGRLDLVAQQYAQGLRAYPHVDRFLAWHATSGGHDPNGVAFVGRDGGLQRDPALGRAILDLARTHAPAQQIYVAAEAVGPHKRHDVFLRLFWNDAHRVEYFAILGFVIDRAHMREQLFGALGSARLQALLRRRGGDVPLQLRITDDSGQVVYGNAAAGAAAARVPFEMTFYPRDEIHSRLSTRVVPRAWSIEVNAPTVSSAYAGIINGYGLTVLSVGLMLVALVLTLQAHRRSSELARMQSDFVAHVSHQLKTPLSLLSTATETLQMDRVRSPERFAEYLATIHAEAARLTLLVQRVLEFSRVQQRPDYEFERTDLGALVRETVNAFRHSLSNQHFSFSVIEDGPSPIVLADPAALEQVLVNLLDNAVKYSDADKTITVRVSSSRKQATVEIVDRGMGIAPHEQKHIFERFYRTAAARQRPGFGLGLPLVREHQFAHRGRVEVDSTPSMGSTFRVVLPEANS
jgi:signal transduction histidine kinase